MAVSAIYAEKGFLYPAPKPKEEYTKFFAGHYLSRYMSIIELRARHSVTFGIIQYLDAGNDFNNLPKILIAGLEAIENSPHYEITEALGVLSQAKKEFAKAKSFYEKSIGIIQMDSRINSTAPPWSENIERLRKRIESLGIITT